MEGEFGSIKMITERARKELEKIEKSIAKLIKFKKLNHEESKNCSDCNLSYPNLCLEHKNSIKLAISTLIRLDGIKYGILLCDEPSTKNSKHSNKNTKGVIKNGKKKNII